MKKNRTRSHTISPPWADIHTHSTASDGTLSPKELVQKAHAYGLGGLSITDHDTVAAYSTATAEAQQLGIKLGTGIEFSCVFEGHDVHLLGYDFEIQAAAIQELCGRHKQRRAQRNLKMLELLQHFHMDITTQDITGYGDSVGRPHIAQAMVQKGYVSSIKEAFNRYLGEGKQCYVRGESLSVDETIEVIHQAHGKAFIAHPHLLAASFPMAQLLEKPFDGIECWYAKLTPKKAEKWVRIAYQKNWLMSGGSDFHGSAKPDIQLGCQGVDRSTFERIFEHSI